MEKRRLVQIDVYNIEQKIERYLDREEKVDLSTDRCIQHRIIDREKVT
jgi:hypothetical protein